MAHATHWQALSQISPDKVPSLRCSNSNQTKKVLNIHLGYTDIGTWNYGSIYDLNISSIPDQYLASSGAISSQWKTAARNHTPELNPYVAGATPHTRSAAASHADW
jgi:hypothetical protein